MKTPNTQLIQDDVLSRFDGVRAGAWSCRRIAGTLTWSSTPTPKRQVRVLRERRRPVPNQHVAGRRDRRVHPRRLPAVGGACPVAGEKPFRPRPRRHLAARLRTPPCKGGDLRVAHRDLSFGRTFHTEVAPTPPPPPPSIDIDLVPVTASSNPQVIGLLQERINQTFYKDGEGLTIESPPRYGNGTASAVKKWLVPLTGDTDPDVQARQESQLQTVERVGGSLA